MTSDKHWGFNYDDCLMHHGIMKQRWGFRRFQNPDGSLTPEGRVRYSRMKARRKERERRKAERAEEHKEKVMRSGNAKKIIRNRQKLNDEELDRAIERAKKLKELEIKKSNMPAKVKKSKLEKLEALHKRINNDMSQTAVTFKNVETLGPKFEALFNKIRTW